MIIDAAVELKKLGYEIYLYTAHHDVARCFEDTIEKDGKRCDWIRVHGSWIPRHIFGFLHFTPVFSLKENFTDSFDFFEKKNSHKNLDSRPGLIANFDNSKFLEYKNNFLLSLS